MNTRPPIAILTGSGFSIPAGLPGVSDINSRLSRLTEKEFYLLSDQRAGFYYSDWKDPNGWMPDSRISRLFLEKLIQFYCKEFIAKPDQFDYEKFYDFINDFLFEKVNASIIESFCKSFEQEFEVKYPYTNNAYNWLWKAQRLINSLLADLLNLPKYYEDVGFSNYTVNAGFFAWLAQVLKQNIVTVHSLNHDLFFDFLTQRLSGIFQYYTDGYSLMGSNVYGEVMTKFQSDRGNISKTFNVRLKKYNGNFNGNLKFYKLHGSIDNYVLRIKNGSEEIRVKKDYGVGELRMETVNPQTGDYQYESTFNEVFPEFLSGTTTKIKRYGSSQYKDLFEHFETNLGEAGKLLIIGYGFQDNEINNIIERKYLSAGKQMIVVDIKKPTSPILDRFNDQISYCLAGADAIQLNNWHELMETDK